MVSALQTIEVYELLSKHFNNREDAQVLVEGIEDIIAAKFDSELDRLATKDDLKCLEFDLRQDIARLEKTTKVDLLNTTEELSTRISSFEIKLEQNFKDQLKWLIFLMLGFATLIIGLLKLT